jgi:hypothetical protein
MFVHTHSCDLHSFIKHIHSRHITIIISCGLKVLKASECIAQAASFCSWLIRPMKLHAPRITSLAVDRLPQACMQQGMTKGKFGHLKVQRKMPIILHLLGSLLPL